MDDSDLDQIQQRTFAGATQTTRTAYPQERQLRGRRLTRYLDKRSIAVISSVRADGRPHSALSSYIRLGSAFWLPTMAGAIRTAHLRAQPWLVLVIAEGDGAEHVAVIIEGEGRVIAAGAEVPAAAAAAFPRPWVASWLRLDPQRLLSYADQGMAA